MRSRSASTPRTPPAGFLPQTGTVERIAIPGAEPFAVPGRSRAGRGLRLDSGVEDGTVVGPDYDPMLAKLIAWAPDPRGRRGAARERRSPGRDRRAGHQPRLPRPPARLGAVRRRATPTPACSTARPGFSAPLVDAAGRAPVHAAAAALAAMAERRDGRPGARLRAARLPQQLLRAAAGLVRDRRRRRARGRLRPAARRRSRSRSPGRRSTEPRIHGLDPGSVDLEVAGVRRRYSVRRSGGIHHVNGPDGQVEPARAAALSRAARGRSAREP